MDSITIPYKDMMDSCSPQMMQFLTSFALDAAGSGKCYLHVEEDNNGKLTFTKMHYDQVVSTGGGHSV